MRKNIFKLLVAFILLGGIILTGYNECHYNREGYILHTTFNNLVVFIDDCGNEWEMFTDGEPFVDGQQVKVKFFDNYTPCHIKDDKIINYKYL